MNYSGAFLFLRVEHGTGSLPREFYEDMKNFSRRELPIFRNREEALKWLVDDSEPLEKSSK